VLLLFDADIAAHDAAMIHTLLLLPDIDACAFMMPCHAMPAFSLLRLMRICRHDDIFDIDVISFIAFHAIADAFALMSFSFTLLFTLFFRRRRCCATRFAICRHFTMPAENVTLFDATVDTPASCFTNDAFMICFRYAISPSFRFYAMSYASLLRHALSRRCH